MRKNTRSSCEVIKKSTAGSEPVCTCTYGNKCVSLEVSARLLTISLSLHASWIDQYFWALRTCTSETCELSKMHAASLEFLVTHDMM